MGATRPDPDALSGLRWVGRGLTLAATWPLGYAFFGKLEFDREAMMFGGPGVLTGLALWTWSGYRLRHPIEGAAPTPSATIGGRLSAKFDALIAGSSGSIATIGLALASLACASGLGSAIHSTARGEGELAVIYALFTGALVLGWLGLRRRWIALCVALLAGAALLAKPWVAPVSVEFMGEIATLSPTSETHLYFVIPGLALIGLAVILVLGTNLAEPAATTSTAEPIELEPPKFPRPPGLS